MTRKIQAKRKARPAGAQLGKAAVALADAPPAVIDAFLAYVAAKRALDEAVGGWQAAMTANQQ